jgi:hypothetical protein
MEAARFEGRGIWGLKLWATRHKGTRSRRGRCSSGGGGCSVWQSISAIGNQFRQSVPKAGA